MIPKIIHYCWFGPKLFSRTVRKCIATWHKYLSDYEFRLWNEESCATYAAINGCGGVYLDTDMYVVRSFDDLLGAKFFAAWENSKNDIVSCGVIGCARAETCLREILTKYDTLEFDTDCLDKFIVPRIITPILLQQTNVKIYEYDYFYPFPYVKRQELNFIRYKTSSTYAIHLWDLSWKPWYTKWIGNIVRICKTIKHNLCALS